MLSLRDMIYQVVICQTLVRRAISNLSSVVTQRLPRHSFAVPRNDDNPLPIIPCLYSVIT